MLHVSRVGEAERQLRLLFEEAARCAPSIIFFDEIDGLAPVRSAKQVGGHGCTHVDAGQVQPNVMVLPCYGSRAKVLIARAC
jgi:AAA+ superfamily predicted ATPase